jgi:DNA primase
MFDEIVRSCHYLLRHCPDARECREYLDARLNKESQELFQFGFFPRASSIQLLIDLVGEEALENAGLWYRREIEDAMSPRSVGVSFFENYPLVLPFRNPYGEIIALVGRTLLSEEERGIKGIPKYKNTVFKKGNVLFGLYENKQAILEQDHAFIVEGQFDVIKAAEKGLRNVVAVGNAYLSAYQFSVISRYTTNMVLLLDNDEPGQKGRKRARGNFGKLASIRDCYLPAEYKDIDEFFSKNDMETWKEIAGTINP